MWLTTTRIKWAGTEISERQELLSLAQETEFDVFLTVDQRDSRTSRICAGRKIAVIVMIRAPTLARIVTLAPLMPQVLALLPTVQPGQVYFVPPQDETEQEL